MKIIELKIDELDDLTGFEAVALVGQPAHEAPFYAFNEGDALDLIEFELIKNAVQELFVDRLPGESQDDYVSRCIPVLIDEGYDQEQAAAICYASLGKQEFESYSDYPKAASENAKIALRWAEENGWGDCGTPVGKARANQLAKGEPISEETISRMASFARHRENGQRELGDGCGRLMWLAWGGDEGVDWAIRKLEQLKKERLSQEFSYFNDLPSNVQDNLLETLANKGIKRDTLESEGYILLEEEDFVKDKEKFNLLPTSDSANPKGSTSEMRNKFKILYQYRGPKDEKNRDFCRRLLDLDLLFRKEDIDQMSLIGVNSDFAAAGASTYDILQFKGGIHCRHTWKKVYTYQKQEMSSQKTYKHKFATDGDNQLIVGPLLIPDKLIFRMDENGDPYFVYFSKDTVTQIANKMMRSKLLDQVNLEHNPEDKIDGYMVESWIITDTKNDKSNAYGFNYPEGTWMGMYKIDNSSDWKKVKDGEVTGFSIEGYFADKLIQA